MNKKLINGCAISVLPSKYDAIMDKQMTNEISTDVTDDHSKNIASSEDNTSEPFNKYLPQNSEPVSIKIVHRKHRHLYLASSQENCVN